MAEKLVPGGFLGASLIAGGGGGLFLSEPVTNGEADTLLRGEVVRLSGNNTVLRAQADVPANAVGLVGAMFNNTATGGLGSVANSGRAFVLLEPALVPVAGQALWVSATTAGRATNVAPATPIYLGVIKDASGYATTGGVIADLAPNYALSTTLNTLSASYGAGTLAADQTLSLLDIHGGGVVLDGTAVGFTGANMLALTAPGGGYVYFPRVGGMQMVDNRTIAAPVALTTWRAFDLQTSTITLTVGGVAPSRLDFSYLAAPVITQTAGAAYVVPACSTLYIAGPPSASAAGGGTPALTAAGIASLVVADGNSGFGTTTPSGRLVCIGKSADLLTGFKLTANAFNWYFDHRGSGGGGDTNAFGIGTDAATLVRIDPNGNVILWALVAGATAQRCLALSNEAVSPTASANLCHLYCLDHNGVAGAAALAVWQEAALVASGDKAATHEWLVTIDGTPMWVLCRDSA